MTATIIIQTDAEKLAKIIKDNPESVAYIDNDSWHLNKATPDEYEGWTEEEQEQWYENSEIAKSDDFPSTWSGNGYGLLEAMAILCGITLEGV